MASRSSACWRSAWPLSQCALSRFCMERLTTGGMLSSAGPSSSMVTASGAGPVRTCTRTVPSIIFIVPELVPAAALSSPSSSSPAAAAAASSSASSVSSSAAVAPAGWLFTPAAADVHCLAASMSSTRAAACEAKLVSASETDRSSLLWASISRRCSSQSSHKAAKCSTYANRSAAATSSNCVAAIKIKGRTGGMGTREAAAAWVLRSGSLTVSVACSGGAWLSASGGRTVGARSGAAAAVGLGLRALAGTGSGGGGAGDTCRAVVAAVFSGGGGRSDGPESLVLCGAAGASRFFLRSLSLAASAKAASTSLSSSSSSSSSVRSFRRLPELRSVALLMPVAAYERMPCSVAAAHRGRVRPIVPRSGAAAAKPECQQTPSQRRPHGLVGGSGGLKRGPASIAAVSERLSVPVPTTPARLPRRSARSCTATPSTGTPHPARTSWWARGALDRLAEAGLGDRAGEQDSCTPDNNPTRKPRVGVTALAVPLQRPPAGCGWPPVSGRGAGERSGCRAPEDRARGRERERERERGREGARGVVWAQAPSPGGGKGLEGLRPAGEGAACPASCPPPPFESRMPPGSGRARAACATAARFFL
eukprot:scaffold408_cov388-Prasinococcus_capsulatus_cf.AAC.21